MPPPEVLRLENFTLAHPGMPPLLEKANLHLRSGDRVALVGDSGCGKTSLMNVLLRLTEPAEGRIRVGERDLRELDPEAWRECIAHAGQEPYWSHASLLWNLGYGSSTHPSPGQAAWLLKRLGLDRVVPETVSDWHQPISPRHLSGGEKQRLALARALLRDRPLLLLDEPTSAVDLVCEETVADLLETRLKRAGGIAIFITHRPSLLRLATRIVRIHQRQFHEVPISSEKEKPCRFV